MLRIDKQSQGGTMSHQNEKQTQEWSNEKIKELAKHVERMEKENEAFFQQLGISSQQIQEFLSNPANFSKPVYEIIKRQRDLLLAALDRKISEARPKVKSTPNRLEVGARGHWIFVR